jgi:hypothetical protein
VEIMTDAQILTWMRLHLDHHAGLYREDAIAVSGARVGDYPLGITREDALARRCAWDLDCHAGERARLERLATQVWREYLAARGASSMGSWDATKAPR